MSLLKKSQDIILQKFLEENTFSAEEKKILRKFSFVEYIKTQKKNSFFTKAFTLFAEQALFASLTYPLDISINQKIKLLENHLSFKVYFSLLINNNTKSLKVIYPTTIKKNIDLNPLLMKKLPTLEEDKLKKILTYLLFPDKKIPFHLHKIFIPKNNLVSLVLFNFPGDFLDKKVISAILNLTFS